MPLTSNTPGGGGSGTVTSVTAADTSIVVGGTAAAPTVATGTLDVIAADHAPAADWSNNGHAITSVSDLAVSGLTGATAATRYVGGTASGAPASGTFAVGDYIITQDGHVFVCTTAGTPGTWTDAGSVGNLVTSVFSRTGAVVATTGDYTAAQVTSAADKSSASNQTFSAIIYAPGLRNNSPSFPTGYAVGAGGTVTQLTSRTTAVTINKPCGTITTFNSSMASGAAFSFTVNNSVVSALDTVQISDQNMPAATTTGGFNAPWVSNVQAGSFVINYVNVSNVSQTTAVVFNFTVTHSVNN